MQWSDHGHSTRTVSPRKTACLSAMLRNATYLKRSEPFPFGMPVSEMIGGLITVQPPCQQPASRSRPDKEQSELCRKTLLQYQDPHQPEAKSEKLLLL